jgi:hypothetical protein
MKSLPVLILLIVGAAMLASCGPRATTNETPKPRVIVTCDPELDDNNSLIRYLLYSTDFDTEGLIYASSQVHWKGDGKGGTQYIPGREYSRPGRDLGPQTSWRWAEDERFIDDNVEAYGRAYSNLKVHNPDYPTPEYLRSIIRMGNVEFEGDISQDTPGSDLIRQTLLDDDPRPVYIQVWGGPSTASRALKSIEEEYSGADNWSEIKAKVSEKAVLCLSGCQDTSFPDYVRPNWPDVKVIMINKGVIPIGYGAMRGVPDPSDTVYYAAEWTAENILKGPLGANYRVWGDGKQMAPDDFTDYFGLSGYTAEELSEQGYWVWTPPQRKGNFISEGDTPMFLNFIDNGLRAYEDDTWGGWAGRLGELSDREMANGYTVAFGTRGGKDEVLPDFVPAVQNSFAARMKWSVTPEYADANHEPVVSGPVSLSVAPGKKLKFKVKAFDPDGDNLTLSWAQYKVFGAYQGDVSIDQADPFRPVVTIPADAGSGEKIHLVLTAQDDGEFNLVTYLRTIITIQ